MVTTHAPNPKDESIVILRPKGIGKVSLVKSQTDPPAKKGMIQGSRCLKQEHWSSSFPNGACHKTVSYADGNS